MNQPSREQIEARITALLLGELPAAEAELLRWTIAQDAGLQKLHDELQSTIVLVREAVKPAAAATVEKNAPLKLSDERRRILLAHFKTPRPKPSIWVRPIIQVPRLVTVLALVALVALVAAMLLPALSASKSRGTYGTMHGGAWDAFRERFLGGVSSIHEDAAANYAGKPAADGELKKVGLQFRTWGADNSGGAALAAAAPPATAPATITLAPEPVLAPPPVQIVLPATESPAQVATMTGSLADSGKGGVISQSIVGGIIQNNSGAAATPPADLFAFQTSAGGQPVSFGSGQSAGVVNSFNGATDTRFGGGSGGGGGGAGGASTANSTALAWNDSGVNRSGSENPPGAAGHGFGSGFSLLGPKDAGGEVSGLPPAGSLGEDPRYVSPKTAGTTFAARGRAPDATPQEKMPTITPNGIADFGGGKLQELFKVKNSGQLLTSGLKNRDGVDFNDQTFVSPVTCRFWAACFRIQLPPAP